MRKLIIIKTIFTINKAQTTLQKTRINFMSNTEDSNNIILQATLSPSLPPSSYIYTRLREKITLHFLNFFLPDITGRSSVTIFREDRGQQHLRKWFRQQKVIKQFYIGDDILNLMVMTLWESDISILSSAI